MTEVIIKPRLIGGLSNQKHRYQNSVRDTPYSNPQRSPTASRHESNRSMSNYRSTNLKSITSSIRALPELNSKLDKSVTDRSIHSVNASINMQRSKTAGRSVSVSERKSKAIQASNSAMNIVEENYGIQGYTIAKHAFYDQPNKNIANWKSRKLPTTGKHTFFDDEIRLNKSKLSPQLYAKQWDWKER